MLSISNSISISLMFDLIIRCFYFMQNGPKQIVVQPQVHLRLDTQGDSSIVAHSAASLNGKKGQIHNLQSPTSVSFSPSVDPRITESSSNTGKNVKPITEIKNISSRSSDALQMASAAIAAAERASAAARAAAQLVNVRFTSFKLADRKF